MRLPLVEALSLEDTRSHVYRRRPLKAIDVSAVSSMAPSSLGRVHRLCARFESTVVLDDKVSKVRAIETARRRILSEVYGPLAPYLAEAEYQARNGDPEQAADLIRCALRLMDGEDVEKAP